MASLVSPTEPPDWFQVQNADALASPSLLIYLDRIQSNLKRMIEIAGGVARLRPHVKTHKLAQILKLHLAAGISKFKCATVAEAEMLAENGAPDILLAYQPVGPNIPRCIELLKKYPKTRLSVVADCAPIVDTLGSAAASAGKRLPVWIDLDLGLRRTGIPAGPDAQALAHRIARHPALEFAGLHAYDGHITDSQVAERAQKCNAAFEPIENLRRSLLADGLRVPNIVAGGTPTFPIHAKRAEIECSPGTCVLWDAGYASRYPDLDFLLAATLLTRVISRPGPGRLCLDLGHKAVASEMPHPRVLFPGHPEFNPVVHSEEHLVVETPAADQFPVGAVFYGVPWHICPTVALHAEALVVEGGRVTQSWPIAARARKLTV